MKHGSRWQALGALGVALLATTAAAQQPPDTTRTLIVGENPSIDHKAKPGGFEVPSVTTANLWRVSWSPFGPGVACFIIVNEPTPAAQKFVITDNPKLAEYIASKEVLERLIPTWNTLSGVNSKQQEIVIDGKRAPGQYASGFLALNETWRVEK